MGPTDLLKAQVFYIHKATIVVVIYKDKKLVFATF